MKDVLAWIQSRRSTRKFLSKPIPKELLHTVIEAGRYAPSGGNSQTTHFLVVESKEVMEHLITLVTEGFARMEVKPGLYRSMVRSIELAKKGNYVFQYGAPVLIITANQKDYGNNIADCSCALENMMLMANGLDLGSCWINQLKWLNEDPAIVAYLQSLGMKENERVYGALAVGYADTENGMPNRAPLQRTGNEVTYL